MVAETRSEPRDGVQSQPGRKAARPTGVKGVWVVTLQGGVGMGREVNEKLGCRLAPPGLLFVCPLNTCPHRHYWNGDGSRTSLHDFVDLEH